MAAMGCRSLPRMILESAQRSPALDRWKDLEDRSWRFSDIRRRTSNVGDSSESGRETDLIGLTFYEYTT